MKRGIKKILVLIVLSLLVSSVFAIDWVRYGTYENADVGTYDVYFNYEATEPFDLEKESIAYFLHLQQGYEKVEVRHIENKDWYWCNKGVEPGCYATLERYGDRWVEDHVNSDGTVTEYIRKVDWEANIDSEGKEVREIGGTSGVCLEKAFLTAKEANAARDAEVEKYKDDLRSEIADVESLLKFPLKHCLDGDEYTDWQARAVYEEYIEKYKKGELK